MSEDEIGKTFEAELEIVNLGIWLYEQGLFSGKIGLIVYYSATLILTLGIQTYLTVLAYY